MGLLTLVLTAILAGTPGQRGQAQPAGAGQTSSPVQDRASPEVKSAARDPSTPSDGDGRTTASQASGSEGQPASAAGPSPEGQEQGAKPLNLPVSVDKIREALQQPPAQPLKGLDERPQFHVEITERQKLEDFVKSLKFDSGPPVPGGLYAYEQQRVLFPKVDNPLIQPYAAFNQSELLVVSLTSLIERYLAGKLVNGVEGAGRAAAQAEAKQEVERAIAAYCSAQPNGGAGIRICSEPLK